MPNQDNRSEDKEKNVQSLSEDTEVKAANNQESDNKDTLYSEQAELSRKAQQMGESRKRMAETLISLAATDEKARKQLHELASDPSERAYLEKKFGESFTTLLEDSKEVDKKEESLPAEALKTLNELVRERELEKRARISSIKEQLGLTLAQADEFDDIVANLQGKTIGGKPVTLEVAAEMAARQLRPDTQVSFMGRGDVVKRPEDSTEKEIKIPVREISIQRHKRYTKATSAEDYIPIMKSVAENGSYKISL